MSTKLNIYLMYGVKLPYTSKLVAFIEANEKELDKDLDIIMDGMGGEYIIMGRILYNSGNVFGGTTNDGIQEFNIHKIDSEVKPAVYNALRKHFAKRERYLFENPLQLIQFTHYT